MLFRKYIKIFALTFLVSTLLNLCISNQKVILAAASKKSTGVTVIADDTGHLTQRILGMEVRLTNLESQVKQLKETLFSFSKEKKVVEPEGQKKSKKDGTVDFINWEWSKEDESE